MCCRVGVGGSPPPSLGAFGLATSQAGNRGRVAPLAFHLLHLFFPPPCPRVGGEKLEAELPPKAYRNLLRLVQVAALPLPLELLGALIHDIFSNLQHPPWILLFLSGFLDVESWF